MLNGEAWQFFEIEIITKRPEKGLNWEFKHISISNPHRDEIVILDSIDFTPENKFFTVLFRLQLTQTHFQLHPEES